MNDDAALLRRYAWEKSEAAFAELVRRHLDLVYSAALRRLGGDPHRAADVAQQVFTTLARDAEKLSRHGVLTAWLYTATRNAAIDIMRSEQRRRTRELEAFTMQTSFAATPDADWEKLRPVLDEVMDELPDADRTAVLLRFFDRRPFAEVGAALHLSEDAARMRVERALEKLRVLLSRRGVTSTSSALAAAFANQAVTAAPAGLATSVVSAALVSAGGATASGLAGGLLASMSTSKIAAGIAGLLLVATLGITFREFRASRATDAATASGRAENALLEAKAQTLKQKAEAVTSEAAALKRAIAAIGVGSPGPDPSQPARGGRGGGGGAGSADLNTPEAFATGREFLAKHPEARRALELGQRESFERGLGAGYTSLQLSPEEQEAIYGEFVRLWPWQLRVSGIRASMGAGRSQSSREIDPFIRALVGEERFKRYENNRNIEPVVKTLVQTLAGATYDLDSPLTTQQAEVLFQMLERHPARSRNVWLSSAAPQWAEVRTQLDQVLSPEQLARLDLVLASGAVNSRQF